MRVDEPLREEMRELDDQVRWEAVEQRDARFNGVFVYGVRSTRVYCKPSCPSRRPRRDQAVFLASPEAAEAAGFRACLRCAPREESSPDAKIELTLRACRLLETSEDGPLSLTELSARLGISPHHLQRTFKSVTGVSPRQYAAAHRFKTFKANVQSGSDVTGALYEAGYGSSSRLYESANRQLGMTPAAYRRGGKGMTIHFTSVACPLGRMLIAATERGVCVVSFGDRDDEMEAALAAEYPAATFQRDDGRLMEWAQALQSHLEGSGPSPDLPLDVRATAFQMRVWEELRKIPRGETRSYAEVAEAIGQPTATRAVARACATNPVALLTPCHRVIRGDGSLSGYRWGLERKATLLVQESGASSESGESAL